MFEVDTATADTLAEIGERVGGQVGQRLRTVSEDLRVLDAHVMDLITFPDPDPVERERKAREALAECARVRTEIKAVRRELILHTMRQVEVVFYDFEGERFCPPCMIRNLPTGEGEAFDGWALAEGADPMNIEYNLTEVATAFGIIRDMDQMEFPVRVHRADLQGHRERCSDCGEMFG